MENDNHPDAHKYLDCSHCVKAMPKKTRALWNCGLINPRDRKGPGFPCPPGWGGDAEVCPGYLIGLPQVIEASRARLHWEKGLLKERYEDEPLTGLLLDCIEILTCACSEAVAQYMKDSRQ